MLVDYKNLSDSSKVYIYPSSRKFYKEEFPIINGRTEEFLNNFEGVNSFYEIKFHRFIVIIVSDKTPLSIEKNDILVTFIQSLEKEFNVSLLDKVNVCFKQGEYVQLKEISEFKKLIKNRSVSNKTMVFDNLINTKEEYENYWELPAKVSWISHFFSN